MTVLASVILILSLCYSTTGYTTSTDCISCLKAKSTNKFCMASPDSQLGFCCDKSDTTDNCSNSRFMCSDRALVNEMKYAYCPFMMDYCTGSS